MSDDKFNVLLCNCSLKYLLNVCLFFFFRSDSIDTSKYTFLTFEATSDNTVQSTVVRKGYKEPAMLLGSVTVYGVSMKPVNVTINGVNVTSYTYNKAYQVCLFTHPHVNAHQDCVLCASFDRASSNIQVDVTAKLQLYTLQKYRFSIIHWMSVQLLVSGSKSPFGTYSAMFLLVFYVGRENFHKVYWDVPPTWVGFTQGISKH